MLFELFFDIVSIFWLELETFFVEMIRRQGLSWLRLPGLLTLWNARFSFLLLLFFLYFPFFIYCLSIFMFFLYIFKLIPNFGEKLIFERAFNGLLGWLIQLIAIFRAIHCRETILGESFRDIFLMITFLTFFLTLFLEFEFDHLENSSLIFRIKLFLGQKMSYKWAELNIFWDSDEMFVVANINVDLKLNLFLHYKFIKTKLYFQYKISSNNSIEEVGRRTICKPGALSKKELSKWLLLWFLEFLSEDLATFL